MGFTGGESTVRSDVRTLRGKVPEVVGLCARGSGTDRLGRGHGLRGWRKNRGKPVIHFEEIAARSNGRFPKSESKFYSVLSKGVTFSMTLCRFCIITVVIGLILFERVIPIRHFRTIAVWSGGCFSKLGSEFYSKLSKRVNYPFEFASLRVRPHAVVRLG